MRATVALRTPLRHAEPLADEAIRLGRLLVSLFPADPEVFGLLALMLLQQSRAPARFDANGEIVLLRGCRIGAAGIGRSLMRGGSLLATSLLFT